MTTSEFGHNPIGVEDHIHQLEHALDISDRPKRMVWAASSGLIPAKRFDLEIINGNPAPERCFGPEALASYMDASLYLRDHADPFSPAAMAEAHRRLQQYFDPGGPSLPDDKNGGFSGQRIRGAFLPRRFTDAQRLAIESPELNPLLTYVSDEPDDPNLGFIGYPTMSQEERAERIGDILARHQLAAQSAEHHPYKLAGGVQREIASLYPAAGSGRLGRLYLNQSLAADGLPAAVIRDFKACFFTPDIWPNIIEEGSRMTAERAARVQSGVTDPLDVFGLRELKEFTVRHSIDTTLPTFNPKKVEHHEYAVDQVHYVIGRAQRQLKLGGGTLLVATAL